MDRRSMHLPILLQFNANNYSKGSVLPSFEKWTETWWFGRWLQHLSEVREPKASPAQFSRGAISERSKVVVATRRIFVSSSTIRISYSLIDFPFFLDKCTEVFTLFCGSCVGGVVRDENDIWGDSKQWSESVVRRCLGAPNRGGCLCMSFSEPRCLFFCIRKEDPVRRKNPGSEEAASVVAHNIESGSMLWA